MSFFITSVGKGDGANYGGLAGADAYCQQMGTAAGRGAPVVWHAYLSTQGPGAVNARDRIGNGPWFNARGGRIGGSVAELHGDTIEQARMGNALGKQISLTEKNTIVNGVGDMPNQHDILTGSQPDGRAYTDGMDHTCSNYTSNADGRGSGPTRSLRQAGRQQRLVELDAREPRLQPAEPRRHRRRRTALLLRGQLGSFSMGRWGGLGGW